MPLDSRALVEVSHPVVATVRVKWLAIRSAPWVDTPPAPTPGLVLPGPVLGITCVLFAVGQQGLMWLDRVQRSAWYRAVRPRASDLTGVDAGAGSWKLPPGSVALPRSLPSAPLFTVALFKDASPAQTDVTLRLVHALTHHPGPGRPRVVVTMDGSATDLAKHARQLGAFVVRNAGHLPPAHVHHFPARAVTPWGQLICTDLADYLVCWPRGGVADLHLLPFGDHPEPRHVDALVPSRHPAAININIHPPRTGPGSSLIALDRFSELCRTILCRNDTPVVWTTRDRLDGITGTADLLLVHA